jgi:hypothetical protein
VIPEREPAGPLRAGAAEALTRQRRLAFHLCLGTGCPVHWFQPHGGACCARDIAILLAVASITTSSPASRLLPNPLLFAFFHVASADFQFLKPIFNSSIYQVIGRQ